MSGSERIGPAPTGGLWDAPASAKQLAYIHGMAAAVSLASEVRQAVDEAQERGITKGDAHVLIPALQAEVDARRPRGDFAWETDNYDMGDYDDWRDHPDAIAGAPPWM